VLYNTEKSETLHVFKLTLDEVNALYYAIDSETSDLTPEYQILVKRIENTLYSI
jgi:hypothetical protein